MGMKLRRLGEGSDPSKLGCGHDEARPSKRTGVVVEVDAYDAFETVRDQLLLVPLGMLFTCCCDKPLQPIDQEVTRAAGRIQ
jgi:hypothetical protein